MDIESVYNPHKKNCEKPFFSINKRGTIFFCDYIQKKVEFPKDEYYLIDSYHVEKNTPAPIDKYEMNSDYCEVYTKPVLISNAANSNICLFEDFKGNILLIPEFELNSNYWMMYCVHPVTSGMEVGECVYIDPNIEKGQLKLMPRKFKIPVQF